MKAFRIISIIGMVLLLASIAFARHHTPEERGKALFNDPKFADGTAGVSCNTCHPDGKGLEGVANKTEWKTPGGTFKSLEQAVNICIEMALKGKPLDVKSDQMNDMVAYLKSLKYKDGKAAKKKRAPVGC